MLCQHQQPVQVITNGNSQLDRSQLSRATCHIKLYLQIPDRRQRLKSLFVKQLLALREPVEKTQMIDRFYLEDKQNYL